MKNGEEIHFPFLTIYQKMNANTCKEIYSNTMSMAISGRSGIDYSTDVEKAGEQMVMTSNRLDETLSTLSEKHGNIRSR